MNQRRFPQSLRHHHNFRAAAPARGTGTLAGRLEDVLASWEAMLPALTEVSDAGVPMPPDQLLAACINDLRRAVDPGSKSKFRLPEN